MTATTRYPALYLASGRPAAALGVQPLRQGYWLTLNKGKITLAGEGGSCITSRRDQALRGGPPGGSGGRGSGTDAGGCSWGRDGYRCAALVPAALPGRDGQRGRARVVRGRVRRPA